jgi:CP family cyanate transporter-like MFS transporter
VGCRTLALVGILLVANLRTAVAALADHHLMTPTSLSAAIGVLGMLPPVCFALFGVHPHVRKRHGLENMLVLAPAAVRRTSRGLSARSLLLVGSVITFAGLGVTTCCCRRW